MKTFLLVVFTVLSLATFSQNNKFYTAETGKGDSVKIAIKIDDNIIIDSTSLDRILRLTIKHSTGLCKNETSFAPYKKSVFHIVKEADNESSTNKYLVCVYFNYLASNAYGAEGEINVCCTFNSEFLYRKIVSE